MEWVRQLVIPGILVGALLAANLLSMQQEPAVVPTPAPEGAAGTTLTYPELPGRLIFRSGNELQFLERQETRSILLPDRFALPDEAKSAFAPNGGWVAGFVRQGEESYLDLVNLANGTVTRLGAVEPGAMSWSPDSQQIAVWAGTRIQLFGFNQSGRWIPGDGKTPVRGVAWTPTGSRLAYSLMASSGDRSIIEVVDLSTADVKRITADGGSAFWAPNGEGLIYTRYPKESLYANELLLHKSDGQEVILVDKAALMKANPEVASIQGADPHLLSVQGEFNPASILFTLKFYSGVNPRFAIGTVSLPGTPAQLYLLPVHPDHPLNQNHSPPRPCMPGGLYPVESSILFVANGFGCDGAVGRLERGSLNLLVSQGITATDGLISPDGEWVLRQPSPGVMPSVTAMQGGVSKLIPLYGQPLHWDRG